MAVHKRCLFSTHATCPSSSPRPRGSRDASTQQCSPRGMMSRQPSLYPFCPEMTCAFLLTSLAMAKSRSHSKPLWQGQGLPLPGHLIRRASLGSNQGLSSRWKSPEYVCSEKDNIHTPPPDSAVPHGCPGQTGDRAISVCAWPCILIADSLGWERHGQAGPCSMRTRAPVPSA